MRILVTDDDPGVLSLVARALRKEGHVVDPVATGTEALWHAAENAYDAVVLDVGMPPPDGIEVVRRLRAAHVWTPILLLTAHGTTDDRVRGLDAGADDYLTKPFAVEELRARLRAIVRRGAQPRPAVLAVGDLVVDPASRTAARQGDPLPLTPREYELLELLARHAGTVVSRSEIRDALWDFAFEPESNVVEVTVRRLRDKVDRPYGGHSIRTVRGAGYLLAADR